jgi:dihydroflavonol-4-reductase
MAVVLLTGCSGFIAKHVALRLLNAGHDLRGTVRRVDRGDEVRAAVAPHLAEGAGRLTFVQADLEADTGWTEAVAGVDVVVHTASPFPIAQPKDPQALIRPAVDGTRRVLEAAADAGVKRVVLTSSVAAVVDLSKGEHLHDE